MSSERFGKPLPSFIFSKDAASTRICEFLTTKHVLLSNALGHTDTKSIWYSFEHIENIYKELIYLNADGLRIYMGAYENSHPDFPGQLCLVMIPTRLDAATLGHEDIIMEDDVDFQERPGSEFFLGNEENKAFNYGAPCPTICPSASESKDPLTPCS